MKVRLAIDGSQHSAAGLEEVASRPWPAYVETTQELRRLAPELLAAAAARLKRDHPHLAITTKALEGTPRKLIVQKAADWGADLIVLGSHGHEPLRQALLGSVAKGVAADAASAVEIIRAGRQEVSVRP